MSLVFDKIKKINKKHFCQCSSLLQTTSNECKHFGSNEKKWENDYHINLYSISIEKKNIELFRQKMKLNYSPECGCYIEVFTKHCKVCKARAFASKHTLSVYSMWLELNTLIGSKRKYVASSFRSTTQQKKEKICRG